MSEGSRNFIEQACSGVHCEMKHMRKCALETMRCILPTARSSMRKCSSVHALQGGTDAMVGLDMHAFMCLSCMHEAARSAECALPRWTPLASKMQM